MIASMDDDTIEEYKQLPAYQRDMFFNIPLGGGRWLTIPKPFELGYLSSGVQRIADYYWMGDDAGINEDWWRIGYNTMFPFDFAGVTGGFAGLMQSATNRDFFRQRWIIPPDEMSTSIVARNTESATRIGKVLQEGSRVFSVSGEPTMDARKIDNLIQSQLPYYGTYLLKTSEALTGGATQRQMRFDYTDIGIIKNSPVYAAKDVQWVLSTAKKYRNLNDKDIKNPLLTAFIQDVSILNSILRAYFSEEVQSDRDMMLKAGKASRECATLIRKKWDIPEINFVKMYEDAVRERKK
jgi:hypothetical protein